MIEFSTEVDVRLVDHMGSDASVIQAMLVSTKGADALEAKASQGRINFLMRNRHGTPFEHNSMTFFVAAPIFVFREFHRHRIGFSYNEMSGRYKELPAKFYIPNSNRPLVQEGKPGDYKYVPGTYDQYDQTCKQLRDVYTFAYEAYQAMLANGIAKEIARACLPVAIFSEMFVTCNARSLMAFLSLRTRDSAATTPSSPMYEIELVARRMEVEFQNHFPMVHNAFHQNGRQAP